MPKSTGVVNSYLALRQFHAQKLYRVTAGQSGEYSKLGARAQIGRIQVFEQEMTVQISNAKLPADLARLRLDV